MWTALYFGSSSLFKLHNTLSIVLFHTIHQFQMINVIRVFMHCVSDVSSIKAPVVYVGR